MPEFLLMSHHTGRFPDCCVLAGESREAVVGAFPALGVLVVGKVPEDVPASVPPEQLDFARRLKTHTLGEPVPSWLFELTRHLERNDTYYWYRLRESTESGELKHAGDFGTWQELSAGESLGPLPGSMGGRSFRVVAVSRGADGELDATIEEECAGGSDGGAAPSV